MFLTRIANTIGKKNSFTFAIQIPKQTEENYIQNRKYYLSNQSWIAFAITVLYCQVLENSLNSSGVTVVEWWLCFHFFNFKTSHSSAWPDLMWMSIPNVNVNSLVWRTELWSRILSNLSCLYSEIHNKRFSRLVWILPSEMHCAHKS